MGVTGVTGVILREYRADRRARLTTLPHVGERHLPDLHALRPR